MMWISVSRIHILSILAVVFSAGCTTFDNASRHRQHYWDYEDHVDLSDLSASGVVTIGGSTRTLLGLLGQYCWIESPAKAKRVTVNAGMVDIVAWCEEMDSVLEETWCATATFHFDAIAGHEYEVEMKCDECLRLNDVTANDVVAESPYSSSSVVRYMSKCHRAGFEQDLSTGDDTATIMGRSCWFSNGDVSSLVVDAGPINIDLTCRLQRLLPGYTRVTSSFAFDAEAGHTYIFMKRPFGEKCISLYDNTLRSTPIACEPYEKVD